MYFYAIYDFRSSVIRIKKMDRLEEHLLVRPELGRVINNAQSLSPEVVYSSVSLWLMDINHSIQLKLANGNE
jgi:hypothetical protein